MADRRPDFDPLHHAEITGDGRLGTAPTSPEAAAPANSAICTAYGWTGWTVVLDPPPKAHQALEQTTGLVQAVFQAMVDRLGIGAKAAVPDVNALLHDTGLADTVNTAMVTDEHNAAVNRIRNAKQSLENQHTSLTASVATVAKLGTELNADIFHEVSALQAVLRAAGTGDLSAQTESGLLDRLRTSLSTIWNRYSAVAGANRNTGEGIGPLTLTDLQSLASEADPEKLREYLPYLNKAMLEAGISTPKREAAFLAQILHETDQLRTLTEYGNAARFDRMYGPQTAVGRALGNTRAGDGDRYSGRGGLQITGRSNYRAAGESVGIDLEAAPGQAAAPQHAFDTAAWYWNEHHLNDDADKSDIDAISRKINGGNNGLTDRREIYDKARKIFGAG